MVGDEVQLESGTLRVERMDGRRVDRVRFMPEVEDLSELNAND